MRSAPVKIRKVGLQDLNLIRELAAETFIESWTENDNADDITSYVNDHFSRERMTSELTDKLISYLLVEDGGQPSGYIKLQCDVQPEGYCIEKPMALHRLYIKKEMQGKQLGTLLIKEAIQIARAHACKNLWLGVWNNNLGAIHLYKRMGFIIFGNYQFVMGSSTSEDYLMKLNLEKME